MLPKAALGFFYGREWQLIVETFVNKMNLKRFTKILIFIVLALFVSAKPVLAVDERVLKLSHYLKERNSTLAPYAQTFVDAADKNGLDYTLVPAIAGVESTFGRNHLEGTYNFYGWGGGLIYFDSPEDGIKKVSEGLKKGYLDKGAKTVSAISYIYCPPSHFSWYTKVTNFMAQIDKTDVSAALTAQKEALNTLAFTL